MKNKLKTSKGITLIALVITIIVLLILAGVVISMLTGDNGILRQVARAKESTEQASVEEQIKLATTAAMANEKHKIESKEELIKELAKYGLKLDNEESDVWTVTDQEVVYVIDSNGRVEKSEEVIIDGTKVTPKNITKYLGKKVTNYTGKESVEIDGESYTVSPTYRLYYIDFGGKYGEKGTIYLKAECIKNKYSLPNTDTTSISDKKIKLKNLNPELYKNGNTGPNPGNNNMKAIIWLTNTEKWESLADEAHTKDGDNTINYIIGAPSLEMMIDSYNIYYGLKGETPDTTTPLEDNDTRVKLFYKYEDGKYGYQIAPGKDGIYDPNSADNVIKTDPDIDTMYYPGKGNYYWLASPSVGTTNFLMLVRFDYGGSIHWADYKNTAYMLCPLVSIKSSIQLELEN